MTLSLSLFDPAKGMYAYVQCDELDGRDAAGFEDYRAQLWGSLAMRRRAYRFFPVLRSADLFVFPHEFECFQLECDSVWAQSRDIASEIWPDGFIDRWCPIRRDERVRALRVRGARSIREYIVRIRFAMSLAESRGLGVSIS